MKRMCLAIVVWAALAQPSPGLEIDIQPQNPCSNDEVKVWIGHEFPSTCYGLEDFLWARNGNEINAHINFSLEERICLPVLIWCGGAADVGVLEPGSYHVTMDAWMTEYHAGSSFTYYYGYASADFEVRSASAVEFLNRDFLLYSVYWLQAADSLGAPLNETDFKLLDCESDGLIDWSDILKQMEISRGYEEVTGSAKLTPIRQY